MGIISLNQARINRRLEHLNESDDLMLAEHQRRQAERAQRRAQFNLDYADRNPGDGYVPFPEQHQETLRLRPFTPKLVRSTTC